MLQMSDRAKSGKILKKYNFSAGDEPFSAPLIADRLNVDAKKLRGFMRKHQTVLNLMHERYQRWALSKFEICRVILALERAGHLGR
jgi:hypothetical protein